MADHRCTLRTAHRPVAARFRGSGAIGIRPGQDVVAVRLVTATIDDFAIFRESRLLCQVVLVAVQRGDIVGDFFAFGVVPWTRADAIFRMLRIRGKISLPRLTRRSTGRRERSTIGICTSEATEIAALPRISRW